MRIWLIIRLLNAYLFVVTRTRRCGEKIARVIAWALPRPVAYWAALRVLAHATSGEAFRRTPPTELSAFDALDRWPLCRECGGFFYHRVCTPKRMETR